MARPWAGEEGRVLIAFDAEPLDPSPVWTRVDDYDAFPNNFVAGYDTKNGKQTLLAQTDTGTGTVYINDNKFGLFDSRKSGSYAYNNGLDGRQILLQLYDPVREVWEPQFQGLIDSTSYALNTALNVNEEPLNASIQLNCVDKFDYLANFGLTPGLAGDRPPVSGADGVWYAATRGEVRDRIFQIMADVGLDTTQFVSFSGNVALQTAKYEANESALTALRDCADAELPYIAQSLYVDRYGRVCFHGRYGRFDPDVVSAQAGNDRWDYHKWSMGDGPAVRDHGRIQIRVLEYLEGRNNIINIAICFPQGMPPYQMPNQVFADTTSIDRYGHYYAPPMENILTAHPVYDALNGGPTDRFEETQAFAELVVKNFKDPREAVTALQLKSLHPLDPRGEDVWACLTQLDVNDMVNLRVGYPAGTGFTGTSADDHYVEGRELRVRPMGATYDYVELDVETSPAVWSQDTHGVFPVWGGDDP